MTLASSARASHRLRRLPARRSRLGDSPVDVPGRLLFDLLDWPLDGLPDAFGRNARWASAVGSGLLVGLALVTLLVVAPEIERTRVARGTAIALFAWFVVESVRRAACRNAVWNVPFLALWVLPLLLLDAGRAARPAPSASRAARS